MFVVYVLYSLKFDKIYIGYTTDLVARFKSHNELGKGWTKRFRPWEVVHVEFFDSKNEALKREKNLKGAKGREYIRAKILNFSKVPNFGKANRRIYLGYAQPLIRINR